MAAGPLYWDDYPGIGYDPHSTPEAPCGKSTPPRGHFAETIDADAAGGVQLTVRQDPNRLCYVANGLAEPPVIRVRRGGELKITIRNEITDPKAIDDFVTPAALKDPNQPIPGNAGFFPVVSGMHHTATGETNLHVHGFAVPAVVPQDEVMHTCVDPAVGPANCGQREFTYRYKIPADMPAGLYWYHPHVHGEVQAQMLMGLSGPIVVEGPEDEMRRAAGIEERVFIVRQGADLDAKMMAAAMAAPLPYGDQTPPPPPPAHANDKHRGQVVDTDNELACTDNAGVDRISLNGSKIIDKHPRDTDLARLTIAEGSVQFWRVVNAATDAFLDLGLVDDTGKPLPLTIVARDGAPVTSDAGTRQHPTADFQLVPPSGRLEFLVPAPPAGHKAYFVSRQVDTGCAGDIVPGRKLALVTAGPPKPGAVPVDAAVLAPKSEADTFTGLMTHKTDAVRTIALAEYPRPGALDQNDFFIFEKKPGAIIKPFMMDGEPTVTVAAGTSEEWVVENWTRELHAFHVHQLHFRVLEINGQKQPNPELLDVVNVPFATNIDKPGTTTVPGRVRIKLYFPEEMAGDILFHCHLVDHEDAGMMGMVRVLPKSAVNPTRKAELPWGGKSLAAMLANPPICRPASTATTAP
ncbi:MAG TPA: multicopper oxidase domain-containing protein [Alphaproteobacteria bacterium]|nr:multicopper oxidase domain-containing protein [Alphaproteobacteria bacterium]